MVPDNNFRGQRKEKVSLPKEEYAIVLDVVIENQNSFKSLDIVQAIGTTNFTLLELVPKQGAVLKSGDKVYIGDGKREEIQYIKRAIWPDKLSSGANSELIFSIMDIIDEKEEEFVKFINTIGPVTIRQHALEGIPGVGKKHLKDILNEREEKPFESFEDIKKRCHFLSEPQKAFAERIIKEIEGKEDIKFFVRR
jgi:putative nucleotide binding protein